jgi:plasmid stabilization system protein ParE
MGVLFRPEARLEALEAQAWYENRSRGLGLEFAHALDASIQSACRNPLAAQTIEGDCRRVLMRRFPYSVIYRPDTDGILIVAVFHHHRQPGAWLKRMTS